MTINSFLLSCGLPSFIPFAETRYWVIVTLKLLRSISESARRGRYVVVICSQRWSDRRPWGIWMATSDTQGRSLEQQYPDTCTPSLGCPDLITSFEGVLYAWMICLDKYHSIVCGFNTHRPHWLENDNDITSFSLNCSHFIWVWVNYVYWSQGIASSETYPISKFTVKCTFKISVM